MKPVELLYNGLSDIDGTFLHCSKRNFSPDFQQLQVNAGILMICWVLP
jgi:hypothetical protein